MKETILTKKLLLLLVLVSLCFLSNKALGINYNNSDPNLPNATLQENQPRYVPDEIIVKFKPQTGNKIRINFTSQDLSLDINKLDRNRCLLSDRINRLNNNYKKYTNRYLLDKTINRLKCKYNKQLVFPERLDSLNKRYRVKKLEPVFRSLCRKAKKRNTNIDSVINESRARFPERAKCSPKNAKRPRIEDIYIIKTDKNIDLMQMIEEYRNNPNVIFAEPNYSVNIQMFPNDPYYSSYGSWGQGFDDLWGIRRLDCEQAWDISQAEGIIVAVIDTGIDYTHPDLADNIWINEEEIPGNGIDDDKNGYIDDIQGWDFADKDNDPMDMHGHGTHCAGTVAAAGNNGIGVIGVAPKAKVMAVKGFNNSGKGFDSDLADCIYYAVDNGANILSCSWGRYGISKTYQDAFDYAYSQGVISVAAAGNDNSDMCYATPANIKNVIAVSSIDPDGKKTGFSNYGEMVDISAPGVKILSTMGDNTITAKKYPDRMVSSGYYWCSGTSMACPHVSGVAALAVSYFNPGDFDNINFLDGIRAMIRISSNPFTEKPIVPLGTGIVSAYNALTCKPKPYFSIKNIQIEELYGYGNGNKILEPNELVSITLEVENTGAKNASFVYIGCGSESDCISQIPSAISFFGSIGIAETADNSSNPFIFEISSMENSISFCALVDCIVQTWAFTEDGLSFEQYLDFCLPIRMRQITGKNAKPQNRGIDISGNKIVWEDQRNGNTDIYLYDLEKGKEIQITDNPYNQFSPKISGSKIVWTDNRNGNYDIYNYQLQTGKEIQITYDTANQYNPAFSNGIIAWEDTYNGDKDIYVFNTKTGFKGQITDNPSDQKSPATSDNKIVWEDVRNGNNDIYLYDLETVDEIQITDDPDCEWSPSIYGKNVIWLKSGTGFYGNYSDIYLYNLDTKETLQISPNSGYKLKPAISGNNISWISNGNIYLYSLDSGNEIQITNYPSDKGSPVVCGNKIVWYDSKFNAICLTEIPSSEK